MIACQRTLTTYYIEHFLYVHDIEIIVYLSTLVAAVIFIYGLYRSYRRWFPDGGFPTFNNIGQRIRNLIKYGLLQRKVIYKKYEGIMHLSIFIGFVLLFIGTALRAIEADITLKHMNLRFLIDRSYLIFKLFMNIGGMLAIIGIFMAIIRRMFFKSKNLPTSLMDYILLIDLLIILITGFILDALSTATYRYEWVNGWDFIGYILAPHFMRIENIAVIYRIIWTLHMLLAVFTAAIIPYTKLYHIIAGGILNTFFSRIRHPSAFKPILNIDEIVEKGGIPGAGALIDLSWKQRMDYDACIQCARCADNCPAYISAKPLNPMDLMLSLRNLMNDNKYKNKLVPEYVEPNILWSCVTCGACVHQCPLLIDHVETILDIRRYLLGSGENVPDELMQVSYNLMRYGNPLAFNPADRENFIKELKDEVGVEIADEANEYDYIFWMGCNISYDPNAKNIAKSLLKILVSAGYKIGLLPEEQCCGEPARRIGDELMFKELVKINGENLAKYKFKKLLVSCPHGYNIFKHEYPLYGVTVEVEHYTIILEKLIFNGKIRPLRKVAEKVTYHDPCYLGRWNNIFDPPRHIIKRFAGNKFIELKRFREKAFCCGAGGGHLFFELKEGERIGKLRMDEIKSVKPNITLVACPFCKIMLVSEAPEEIEILDIAEFIYKYSQ